MIRIKKLLTFFSPLVFFLFLSFNAFANWYVDGSVGFSWLQKDQGKMTISEGTGGETDTLKQDKVDAGFMYRIGGGYTFPLRFSNSFLFKKISLGVDAYYSPSRRIEGTTYQ